MTESENEAGEAFGEARLISALEATRGQRAEDLCRAVMDQVAHFARVDEPFDDITCLAISMADRD